MLNQWQSVAVRDDSFGTPEEAALSGFDSAWQPHVVRVEPCDDPYFPGRVWVIVDTVPSHPMRTSCELVDGGWVVVSEVSG